MRNSNIFARTITLLSIAMSSWTCSMDAQGVNPEEPVSAAQGFELKMKHVIKMVAYMQQSGYVSQNPSEFEVQQIIVNAIQTFQNSPQAFLNEIANIDAQNNPIDAQPIANINPASQRGSPQQNQNGKPIYNMQDAESEMLRIFGNLRPDYKINFQNAQAMQLKNTLANAVLVNKSSSNYSSGYGDSNFSMSSSSYTSIQLCQIGVMTIQKSSRSVGGGAIGSLDSGNGGGSTIQGWWSIAEVNGQLCFMTADSVGVEALPISHQGNQMLISNNKYMIYPNQAQCQY